MTSDRMKELSLINAMTAQTVEAGTLLKVLEKNNSIKYFKI